MENKKLLSYVDKSYKEKRQILQEYSLKDLIRYYIELMADKCVNNFPTIVVPQELSVYSNKIIKVFNNISNKMCFNDITMLWHLMKDFLINGYLALEIIWDDKKQNIVSFNRLDVVTLVPTYDKNLGMYWVQFPEDELLKRILLDSQIIFISYNDSSSEPTSYVEGLIKPYNQIKIMEDSIIIFNVNKSTIRQKFTIPTRNLSKQKAEEYLGQLIANYSEHIDWDESLGELTINGSKHLHFNKQIWFSDSENGTPTVENLDNHSSVNIDLDILKYFNEKLKLASKFPTEGNKIEEMRLLMFTQRLKKCFMEILLKPTLLQIKVEIPELIENEFLKQITINL